MSTIEREPTTPHLTEDQIKQVAAAAGGTPTETLDALVRLICNAIEVDVCSVYLLEPDRNTLVLAATQGLLLSSVGQVRMQLSEGLAGMVAEQLRVVQVANAASHPRYKYFPEAGEERYQSFLGVPLVDRGLLQGVLVVQTKDLRTYSSHETDALVTTAGQIGPLIREARRREHLIMPSHQRLWALARNMHWAWDWETVALFRELDPVRWRKLDHNPIALLSETSLEQIEQRADQLVLHNRINYAYRRLREYLESETTWGAKNAGVLRSRPVAYFSAEFGLHESVPTYSGGLGILAGDHIKSASDLDVPLVGIGLYYDQGYFRQRLDTDGWQQEDYFEVPLEQLPLEPALNKDGQPIEIEIATRGSTIRARVWRLAVGRRTLLLLDSDVEGNEPEDRELTARLYGGDHRVRIRQELLLGVGGMKVLAALGVRPGVLHLNEGHSAFAVLEAVRMCMEREGIDCHAAARQVARHTVFTTHTPVPAGHDRFDTDAIEEHLGPLRDGLGISPHELLALGRVDPDNVEEPFCMTVLALKMSRRANAVSCLHGEVSRNMWTGLWPDRGEDEVPIGHITNGVHVPTWLAPQMVRLYDRHLGTDWSHRSGSPQVWEAVERINDGELWETHIALKARLIDFARRRLVRQAQRRDEPKKLVDQLAVALSPDALTIGFARRFATYKRANLIMEDLDRLAALVNDAQVPVQFVFAGKAHPRDNAGKRVLQQLHEVACDPRFLGKIVFLEDYEINVARHLVQGVDVWLNNPRRPLEASGTSGQKVVLNGGLNMSVLDGWWAEAYDGHNGFAIGHGDTHTSTEIHDQRDAQALLHVLSAEVIPLYYRRDRDGLPRDWIRYMKHAIRSLGWRFSADRMVMDYTRLCYVPAASGLSSSMPG